MTDHEQATRIDREEAAAAAANTGPMILIGGNEDKTSSRMILSEVARRAGPGVLVIATLASEEPEAQWQRYRQVFTDLGLARLVHLDVESREQALDPARVALLDDASAVFFTGGDQLKIVTKLGGTPLFRRIRLLHERQNALLAGTSAGASAMGEIMLASHETEDPHKHKVESAFFMTRGLGLIRDMVIDQHFAQRARIERLVGAVAENPGVLGVGIDEDTAVVLKDQQGFDVIGSGAVYVADGHGVTYTNVSERALQRTLCLFDVKLHVLSSHTCFDLRTRRPHVLTAPATDLTGPGS